MATILQKAEKKRQQSKKEGTYVGAAKMKKQLVKKGYSPEYAGAIIGIIARKKYGKKGAAALAATGRKRK